MSDPEVLSSLRNRVASLQVLPCRLAHEQVVIEQGRAKRRSQGIGLDPLLVRVGLCTSEHRSRQLSCAHTRARHVLERAIGDAEQAGALAADEAERMRADLHRIDHAIHMTDWAKSDAEIRFALAAEQQETTQATTQSTTQVTIGAPMQEQQRLNELVEQHQSLVGELRRMHGYLLARLDSTLAACS